MKNQNPDSTATPPEVIEHKGRIAKIYRAKNRDRYRYEVKYRDPDGEWKRETFDEHDAARKHAGLIVKQLDDASQPFLLLRGKERFIYERALDLLRPTGLVLDMAIAEFVEAKTKLKGVPFVTDTPASPAPAAVDCSPDSACSSDRRRLARDEHWRIDGGMGRAFSPRV